MSETVSLITLNSWKCAGDYPQRLALMRRELAQLAPDLLLLQEAYAESRGGLSTPAALARTLAMECRYLPARYGMREAARRRRLSWSGLATLSRWPVRAQTAVTLPSDPRDGERVAQLVVVEVQGLMLLLINVHLTYLPAADALRIAQLKTVLRHPWLTRRYGGVVLAGDFNSPLHSRPMQWLRRQSTWRVTDCFAVGAPAATRSTTIAEEWSGSEPGPNIDYVLLLEGAQRARLRPLRARYVLDRPDPEQGIHPSDHFGLWVEFAL